MNDHEETGGEKARSYQSSFESTERFVGAGRGEKTPILNFEFFFFFIYECVLPPSEVANTDLKDQENQRRGVFFFLKSILGRGLGRDEGMEEGILV